MRRLSSGRNVGKEETSSHGDAHFPSYKSVPDRMKLAIVK